MKQNTNAGPTEFQARILDRLERERDPYPVNRGRSGVTRALGRLRWFGWAVGGGFSPWTITAKGKAALARFRDAKPPKPAPGTCRVCGCTESNACAGGCAWADGSMTICTVCQPGGDE